MKYTMAAPICTYGKQICFLLTMMTNEMMMHEPIMKQHSQLCCEQQQPLLSLPDSGKAQDCLVGFGLTPAGEDGSGSVILLRLLLTKAFQALSRGQVDFSRALFWPYRMSYPGELSLDPWTQGAPSARHPPWVADIAFPSISYLGSLCEVEARQPFSAAMQRTRTPVCQTFSWVDSQLTMGSVPMADRNFFFSSQ